MPRTFFVLLSALAGLAGGTLAQVPVDYVPLETGLPIPRFTIYDVARERTILAGHDPVEWTGTTFERRIGITTPQLGLYTVRAVYDTARARTYVVDTLGDWSFDGRDWVDVTHVSRPPQRIAYGLAYDRARDRVVLFGGLYGGQVNRLTNDTWEWDGSSWTQRTPPVSPPPLQDHVMAYDVARGRTVVFGGRDGTFNDNFTTWEWDGVQWSRANPTHVPTTPWGRLVYDGRAGHLVFVSNTSGLWKWDGVDWTQLTSGYFPVQASFDLARGELVGFEPPSGDPYIWDGVTISRRSTSFSRRSGQEPPLALVPDSARSAVVSHAGGRGVGPCGGIVDDETYRWNGARWERAATTNAPPLRIGFGMVEDPGQGRVILFGGEPLPNCGIPSPTFDDLWVWNGIDWAPGPNANAPSPRSRFAIAWDRTRGQAVVFGGITGDIFNPLSDETWIWDGAGWTQAHRANHPIAREGAKMAFDPARNRCVLFGGDASGETWEWDGANWTQANPNTVPPAASGRHSLFHDPARGVVLYDAGAAWSWNGVDWSPIPTARPLPNTLVTYDPSTGGWIGSHHRFGAFTVVTPELTNLGTGCPGTVDPLVSCTQPALGNGAFRIEVLRAPHQVPALILLGLGAQPTTFAGCTIQASAPWFPFSVTTNTYGAGWLDAPLPLDPILRGLMFHVQAAVPDASVGRAFAATATQRARIGDA